MKTKMNQHLAKQRQKLIKALTLHKKKPKDSSSRLLESCPVDIVDAIVRHLPLEDFRNLRLVNKAINLATILLFTRKYLHTLEIDFTRQGLQRAIEITSHYDVSGTVCFGPRIDTIVFDFENFVWTSEKECAWLSIRLDTFNFNPLQRRGMKKEARKEARKAAQQWRDHREMLVQDGYFQMLATIFRQVERMTVKTHDLRALTYDNLGAYILQVRPRHWWGSVRCKYALSSQESLGRFTFFLQNIFAALRESDAQLLGFKQTIYGLYGNYLPIERLASIINQHEFLPDPLPRWRFMQNCAEMKLNLSCLLDHQPSVEDQHIVVQWFKAIAPSLKSLTLEGQLARTDKALLTVVGALVKHVHFPKLSVFRFTRGNVEAQSLLAFFEKHWSTLKSFTLGEIYISSGQWASLLTDISELDLPQLETITIQFIQEKNITYTDDGYTDDGSVEFLLRDYMQWLIWPDSGDGKMTREGRCPRFNENGVDMLKWIAASIKH